MRRGHLARALLMTAVTLAMFLIGCEAQTTSDTTAPPSTAQSRTTPSGSNPSLRTMTEARVVRVVDGDTIIVEIDGKEERVRYIGVDTPETVRPNSPVECYGEEASNANTNLVEGQTVYLEKDISERDRYDRLLRYVYTIQDGEPVFVNLWLVEQGYAQVSTYPPDVRHEQAYLDAQREAREQERGLWGACPAR